MSAPRLAEADVILIRDYIKANIATALAAIRSDRADAQVSTEAPETSSYFIYPDAIGYKAPAIFIVANEIDFKLDQNKANHINSETKVYVSAVVEDRDASQLTYKAWRYSSALHSMLAQTSLTTVDNKVKITVTIKNLKYSDHFLVNATKGDLRSVFRKEVSLECEVVHRENY